jgi:hypothetical protein
VEVAYAAVSGAGSEQRTRPLLSIADDLARETGDDAGRARLKVCKGLVAYLQGRLATALAELRGAIDALTQHPAGTIWETITAQRFVIASLFFMGRLKSLAEYVPSLLAQAEGTGNLYASMCFRTAYSWGCWFAKDDVPEVKRQLARARDEWKTTGYHLCHCNILIADAYTDLYASDPESALRRLQEQWADIESARLPRVGVLRVQLWQLRAAAAAASAGVLRARGDLDGARRMRREARHFNARLSRDRMGRATPASELIESALRHSEGDHDGAREQLERAIAGFEGQSMALFAAAARARLGALIGGQAGTELLAAAHSDFRTEGVVNVERMIEMLAPGFQLSP